ncbi:MAG: hypothetical protein IBJ00_08155 [Alphaproteobacteria bacterium]|nr:hypothetical protein [Alphaproteobacteria bacterium]
MIVLTSPYIKILSVLILSLSLSACGKKGAPQSSVGELDTYPSQYPMPDDDY